MRIPDVIFQTNTKILVMVNTKNSYNLEIVHHLLLTLLYQQHSDVVVFAIFNFQL